MKKATLFILMITIIIALAGCGGNAANIEEYEATSASTSEESNTSANSTQVSQTLSTSVTSKKDLIKDFIIKVLGGYTDCEITTLTIFDAHNPEAPGTYDCRAIITLQSNVSADVAGVLIQSYSNDLAKKLDLYYPSLSTMELIWMAPEFHGRATLSYAKVDNFLKLVSTSNNSNFALKSNASEDSNEATEEDVEQTGAMSSEPL